MVILLKINKIKKLNSGKYKIEFDNNEKLVTYDDVILKNNLLFNKNVDSETLTNIVSDNEYYDIYNKCIKYISVKMRSQKEIEEYIKKNKCEDFKDKIVLELKNRGLINDSIFIKSYISDRMNLSTAGPDKIRSELLGHNINLNEINEELSKISKEEIYDKLSKLIIKKVKNNNKYSIYHLKQKIIGEMITLGYSKDDILFILDNININDDQAIKKEYDKQYRNLSKKYSGDELNFRIKQKLYQKGFSQTDINNILE